MRKKGFTLIELLAVVVVLGIIATIIVPNVIEIMNKAEKDSFRTSVYGLWTAAKEYYQKESEKGEFLGETIEFPTDKLDYEGEEIKKGNITISTGGEMEIYAGKKEWCAIKGMSDNEIEITDIDTIPECGASYEKPKVDEFNVVNTDEDSAIIVGVCSDEKYGIGRYEYKIIPVGDADAELSAKWQRTTKTTYTAKKLKGNTNYRVKMRCQSNSGVYSDEKETTFETKEANVKCYATDAKGTKLEGNSLTNWINKWSEEKYVKIEYGENSGEDKSYRIDRGNWKTVQGNTIVTVQKPSTVTGRVSDGTNVSSAVCTVSKVDGTPPEASIVIVSTSSYTDPKEVKVGGYCFDDESGISQYEYAISKTKQDPEKITNWKKGVRPSESLYNFVDVNGEKLQEDTSYYVYVRCTNGAGMTSTGENRAKISKVTQPSCQLDKVEWSNTPKNLKIQYLAPNEEEEAGVKKSYTLIKGNATKQNSSEALTIGKEETVSGQEANLTFSTVGAVSATKTGTIPVTCNVTRIDMQKPNIDKITLIPNDWYNTEKEMKIEKHDEGGSGLQAYYITTNPNANPAVSTSCETNPSGTDADNDKWICDTAGEVTVKRGKDVPAKGEVKYYLWVVDNAGNKSERKEIVIDKIEKTQPTCSLEIVSGTKGTNGWYVSDVKVKINTDDKLGTNEKSGPSGVGEIGIYTNQGGEPNKGYTSIGDTITVSKDGINNVYGFVKDRAGNENKCKLTGIKVDQTPPVCATTMQSGSSTYKDDTWKNTNIKTTTQATDETSKLYQIKVEHLKPGATAKVTGNSATYTDSPQNKSVAYDVTQEGINYLEPYAIDMAGNRANCAKKTIKIDKTAPKCTISKNSPTGKNSWYIQNIEAKISSESDPVGNGQGDRNVSGIAKRGMDIKTTANYNGKKEYVYTSDNKSVTIYGYVIDNAGNTTRCSTGALKIDKTAPSCQLTKSGSAGKENWYRSDVTVKWASNGKNDSTSGIASYSIGGTASATSKKYTDDATVTGKVTNGAGLTKECKTSFKIDKVKPEVYYTTSSGPHNDSNGITVYSKCTDSGGSGVDYKTPTSQKVSSPSYGVSKTVTCYDKAGNKATATRKFYVRKYSTSSACGAKTCTKSCCGYKTCTTSACGYKTCRTKACGCSSYNRKENCVICGRQQHITYQTKTFAAQSSPFCPSSYPIEVSCYSVGGRLDPYTCICKKRVVTYTCKTCRHVAFGCDTYKKCANKACGAKTCTTSACGAKTCTSGSCCGYYTCWHY